MEATAVVTAAVVPATPAMEAAAIKPTTAVEASASAAVETTPSTATMETTASTAAVETTTTAATMETSSSAAVTTATLSECWIGCESKTDGSSKCDEGSRKESAHNPNLPSNFKSAVSSEQPIAGTLYLIRFYIHAKGCADSKSHQDCSRGDSGSKKEKPQQEKQLARCPTGVHLSN